MIFLIASILLSTYLTLSFKVLEKLHIPILPSIVFNYIFCVATGSIINQSIPFTNGVIHQGWFKWSIIMGLCFISLFNLIGFTTQKIGIAVASVANKLSMIISVVFFIIFFNDPYNWLKILGIIIALFAVIFTCYTTSNENKKNSNAMFYLPIMLFIGSGFLDALFKWVTDTYIKQEDNLLNQFLITSFGIAGIIGIVILMYQHLIQKKPFSPKAILAGFIIGVPNYFSIYFLGKVYKENMMESSAIIPVNNMAIVLVSTIAAYLFFKEKLSIINWLGILLSIVAIALIAFNTYLI
jgi:uncharacterized membrane protein